MGSVGLTEILLLTVMFITAFFSSGDINRDAVTARFPMSSLALLGSIGVCGISGSSFSNSHAGTAIVVGLPSSMLVVKMRLHSHAAERVVDRAARIRNRCVSLLVALGGARELGYSDASVRGSENSCSHALVIELATRRAAVSLPTPAQSSALALELRADC